MIGIVVITHSHKLTEEIIKFANIFKTCEFNLLNGTDNKLEIGTDLDFVLKQIKEANEKNGVLVFVDLGYSVDIALRAKKQLENEIKVELANAPLLEGLISAVAANDSDLNLEELKKIAEDDSNFKKVK